jgi:hypothetical protein
LHCSVQNSGALNKPTSHCASPHLGSLVYFITFSKLDRHRLVPLQSHLSPLLVTDICAGRPERTQGASPLISIRIEEGRQIHSSCHVRVGADANETTPGSGANRENALAWFSLLRMTIRSSGSGGASRSSFYHPKKWRRVNCRAIIGASNPGRPRGPRSSSEGTLQQCQFENRCKIAQS